jgi:hypothetical protein
MTDETLRRTLAAGWATLESESTSGEHRLRISPLPVDTAQGPLVAAVDHDGYRHLLIPVDANRKIRPGIDGPVLHLVKRPLEDEVSYQTYADLGCLRHDLRDLFSDLCLDILITARQAPENPVKALYGVLDKWKALFQTQSTPLNPTQIAGLFGELLVLTRLLERDPSAHRLWAGPTGHRHDFSAATSALEVKTSTAVEGRRPRIHGLDQLAAPARGDLWLTWFRLGRATTPGVGTGFVELIGQALSLCDDERALLTLLSQAGYRPIDADRYQGAVFVVREERWYQVGNGFPCLTREMLVEAGITVSVEDVEYTIDLSTEFPPPLRHAQVPLVLDDLIRGDT